MKENKVLHLTLKKKWFDMILSGEKKEEYREITTYWAKRLMIDADDGIFKEFDVVNLKHGYAKDAPEINIECRFIRTSIGLQHLGAVPNTRYFVIKLGKILSTKNIK